MKKPRRIALSVLLLVCSVMLSCAIYSSIVERNCSARASIIPQALIYPGSSLTRKVITADTPVFGEVWYEYVVSETFAKVSSFYMENIGCTINKTGASCFGHRMGMPVGTYSVGIWPESETSTRYNIDLVWDRCTSDWHKTIE
jgi:hypothetical protein